MKINFTKKFKINLQTYYEGATFPLTHIFLTKALAPI